MGLTRVAITRPVFILMVISAMVILGLVSFTRLNAELYPNINTPVVTVLTTYSGAAPEDVERLITKPIEDAVAGIANIDNIQSFSSEGRSQVTITFTDAANVDLAASDVDRRVSAIRSTLPQDADAPSVLKVDPSQLPVLYLALTGSQPLDHMFLIAKDDVKPRLETLPGVASVAITGGLEREIQVQINPARLRAYGLTVDQVAQALARENQGVPGGSVERGRQQTNLRLYGLFQTAAELRDLTVASTGNGVVRLGDVAEVLDTYKRVTSRTFLNGREAVSLTVTKQSGANEIATVDAVRAELERLNRQLPGDTRVEVVSDISVFTRHSLNGVERSLVEAVLLTGLVLLVFLHTLRSTTIVLFAIPTSLISTFMVMYFLGFSLNIMSSMALVLVIGVLVDDSIVVLENIFRHLELGETPWSAALKGRSEIGLAAIAITLSDVVIFTPVAFMSGMAGQWFRQFGLVVATATLMSLFISFTLTPMLASRWLQQGKIQPGRGPWGRFVRWFEDSLDHLRDRYRASLTWTLRHRWLPPVVGFATLVLSGAMIPLGLVRFEFIPATDDGYFTITVELPPGSSLAATEEALRQVEARLAALPEVKYYLTQSGMGGYVGGGGNSLGVPAENARYGRVVVVLHDRKDRQRTTQEVVEQVSRETTDIPAATVRASVQGGGGSGQPVQVRVQGEDPEVIQALAARVEQIVGDTPGARNVTNSGQEGNPETRLVPDRRRMADLGVTAQQAAQALRTAVDGTVATKLRPAGRDEIDVRLIADAPTREDLRDLGTLPLSGMVGGTATNVYLSQVTTPETVNGPTSIDRRNRQRVVTIGADLVGTTPLNDVTQPVQRAIRQLQAEGVVPPGYTVALGGQAEDQAKAFGNLFLALGLSLLLDYMLMSALYESMIMPFSRMFSLPVAVVGAFVALAATRNTLNMLSMIGMIVLMGLVGKNGVLLIDYTNTLRHRGLSRTQALLESCPTRLRPILMTTAALLFGMMPLAAKLEEGSELYGGMATVIIGGMLSSTVLSLYVVPSMYTYFDDLQMLILRVWHWRPFRGRGRRPAEPPPREAPPRELEEVGSRA
ncbi:MAG TPA: efflux RND transporter permease subunit [Chloroflexota bacterium]|nr:efflux RND transporter permease subunit [Chloroflexota bacterium]